MKKRSNSLYQFIGQMPPVEKRYFKKYANRHVIGESNDYYELFATIVDKELKSDKETLDQVADRGFAKYFPVAKKHLFDYLLDSAHLYEASSDVREQIKSGLHKLNILLGRGFIKECQTGIKKYRKLILKFELYQLMPELISVEKNLIARSYYNETNFEKLRDLHEEESTVYMVLQREHDYWYIFSQIYKMHYTQLRSRKESDEVQQNKLFSSPLICDVENALTFRCRLDYHQLNALRHFMKGEAKEAAGFNKSFIEDFERSPHMMKIYPERYLSTFNNYLIDLYSSGRKEELKDGIDQLLQLPDNSAFSKIPNVRLQVFRLGEQLRLNIAITEKRFSSNTERIPSINKQLLKYKDGIAEQNRVTFYYLFAYSYFGIGDHTSCIEWTDQIISETDENALIELQLSARLLNLIAHFEIGNDDLLYYTINNTRRYHSRRQRLFGLERAVLSALSKLIGKLPEDRKKIFSKLKEDLNMLSRDPKEKQVMNNFDYIGWVESHLK